VAEAPAQAPSDLALDYAPRDTLRRRRRVRRVAVTLALLAVVVLGFWYGPTAWRRAKNFYAVRYACGYAAPADTVVYRDDPTTARPLLANPGAQGSGLPTAAPDPPAFVRLAAVSDAGYVRMFAAGGSGRAGPGPLVFLHERSTRDGHRYLVAVRVTGLTYYPKDGGTLACSYTALLLQPSDWYSPRGVSLTRAWGGVHIPSGEEAGPRWSPSRPDPGTPAAPGAVRVFFGAADTSDPSAFTVPYEVHGRGKAWRFRLTEQGVRIEDQPKAAGL
jgi:hypothetical protein